MKLKNKEEKFAIKHIADYYGYNTNCKYSELIDSTLDKFEKNILGFNQLSTDDDFENIIVKKLLIVFKEKLNQERTQNKTGLFGVKKAFFSDGTNWYYKNLIKNEFIKTSPIFASNLKELKTKISEDQGIWFVYNQKLFAKSQMRNSQITAQKSRIKRKPKVEKPPKTIDEIIAINSQSESFLEMKKEEKKKIKKSECLDKKLKLNEENKRYKGDRYKFFK